MRPLSVVTTRFVDRPACVGLIIITGFVPAVAFCSSHRTVSPIEMLVTASPSCSATEQTCNGAQVIVGREYP